MDNQLKERLVGATVLVVLAVIFIPMLLDGPGSDQRIRQAVDLPPADNGNAGRKTVRIDLSEDGSQPSAQGSSQGASQGASQGSAEASDPPGVTASREDPVEVDLTADQESTPAETVPESRPPEETLSTGTDTTTAPEELSNPAVITPEPQRPEGAWTVQVGSFGNADNADSLRERLSGLGYNAFVSRYDDGSRVHYRVRVGGYETRDAAASKAAEIADRSGEPARPARND